MKKMKRFGSYTEYEDWTETFENCTEYEDFPVIIDDGWRVSIDMLTSCKSYKTALRRFEKTFQEVDGIAEWIEYMQASCEEGFFQDTSGWKPAWTNDPVETIEFAKNGLYTWGVEKVSEGYWYVYLNISGIYAGRKKNPQKNGKNA